MLLWGLLPGLGPAHAAESILLQSTTSTQASGLFEHLLPRFTAEHGIEVRVVAVGTGQALKNAADGNGDVVLVHDEAAEEAFIAAGHGRARHAVMVNEFVIVGPAADSAGVRQAPDAVAAFARIAAAGALFLSRGDGAAPTRANAACGGGGYRILPSCRGTGTSAAAWGAPSRWPPSSTATPCATVPAGSPRVRAAVSSCCSKATRAWSTRTA